MENAQVRALALKKNQTKKVTLPLEMKNSHIIIIRNPNSLEMEALMITLKH